MTNRKPLAVAVRHVAFEDLGLFAPVLASAGWDVAYCSAPSDDLTAPALAQCELLIVLGGPIGAYEVHAYPFLSAELALLDGRLARALPTLGICLGCQLIAKALGARVFAGSRKEIGWGHVDLTEDGRRSCLAPLEDARSKVLHWHGDTFDLPAGALRLASNENYENQAFAFGRNALALQFHIEADPSRLEEWHVGHAAELSAAGVSLAELRDSTAAAASAARVQAEWIFSDWLRGIGEAR